MSNMVNNKGFIDIGAWSLVVALLLAATCRAGDGTAVVSAASGSSSTSTATPAATRPKIPPPRIWPQASKPSTRGKVRDFAPVTDSAPASSAALSSALDSDSAPSAASTKPATRRSQADDAVSREPANAGRLIRGVSACRSRDPMASVLRPLRRSCRKPPRQRLRRSPRLPARRQDPSLSRPRDTDLTAAPGKVAEPEKAQVDPMAIQSKADAQVTPAGCATCGGFHNSGDGPMIHEAMGCADGSCIPGRKPCYPPADPCNTVVGAFCPEPLSMPVLPRSLLSAAMGARGECLVLRRLRPASDRDPPAIRQPRGDDPSRPQPVLDPGSHARTRNEPGTINDLRARIQQFYVYQEVAGRAWQLLHRVSLPPDQPELGTDPGRIRRRELRHQVTDVRL